MYNYNCNDRGCKYTYAGIYDLFSLLDGHIKKSSKKYSCYGLKHMFERTIKGYICEDCFIDVLNAFNHKVVYKNNKAYCYLKFCPVSPCIDKKCVCKLPHIIEFTTNYINNKKM